MAEQQTKVDGQAEPAPGTSTEESDLDRLAAEFEQATAEPKAPVANDIVPRILKAVKPAVDFVEEKRRSEIQQVIDKDIDDTVGFMLGEDLKGVSPKIARAFLEDQGRADKSTLEAFRNRKSNPAAWEAAREKIRDEFRKELGDLAPNASKTRDDVEAAVAAVRGTSQSGSKASAFDPVKWGNASDREWEQYVAAQARA